MAAEPTIASNLTRIRASRRLSQTALAQKAGISRVALGKIERGESLPRADTLDTLASALRTSVRELVTPVPVLGRVRFRARKQVHGREEILAEVATWLRDYSWLEEQLGEKRAYGLDALGRPSSGDPRTLAANARAALNLREDEAIRDVCGLLEDHGVKVRLLSRATDAFFGLSVAATDGGPAVVVNTWDRISVERWIFTAAHELGHLLLHGSSFDRNEADEPKKEEREADAFAGYFLMPPKLFFAEWKQTAGLALLDRVLKVKRIFRVSYKTVLHRLVEMNEANVKIWGTFQVQHKRRYGKTLGKSDEPEALVTFKRAEEPDRLSESDFLEDRLSRLVRQGVEEGIISVNRGAEILGLTLESMRERARGWAL